MFTKKEQALLKKLNTPAKVQDFLNSLPFNFEKNGETLRSPIQVLRTRTAHCFEGALFGAYVLSLHGFTPYVLHLEATKGDYDHVITPFQINGLWGALSKTNHAVLRYREPVYRDIHELVMSYFHEYFLDTGVKTLRRYSDPLDLSILEEAWITSPKNLWHIDKMLDKVKHYDIISKSRIKKLRKAERIEIEAGKIVEYKSR